MKKRRIDEEIGQAVAELAGGYLRNMCCSSQPRVSVGPDGEGTRVVIRWMVRSTMLEAEYNLSPSTVSRAILRTHMSRLAEQVHDNTERKIRETMTKFLAPLTTQGIGT